MSTGISTHYEYMQYKLKGNFVGLVGVPRMCRRFLKFAYVVVRECVWGKSTHFW